LGLSERNLQRWQGLAGPRKTGRPAHSQQSLDEAKPRVLEVLHTLGFGAGRETVKGIYQDLPWRVINALLKLLKAEHRIEEAQRLRNQRVHVQVLAQGAVLAQDSTHTGNAQGRKAWAEVVKDAATCEAWALGDGKPITSDAMLAQLEALKAQGRLPLVLATDNGSAYKEAPGMGLSSGSGACVTTAFGAPGLFPIPSNGNARDNTKIRNEISCALDLVRLMA
jgi:hypothetical protein